MKCNYRLCNELHQLKPELPRKINLEKIMIEKGVFKKEKKHIPKLNAILGYIYREQKITGMFVPVSSRRIIQKIMPNHDVEKRLMGYLLSWGILEKNNSYQSNVISTGYRISDEYMEYSFSNSDEKNIIPNYGYDLTCDIIYNTTYNISESSQFINYSNNNNSHYVIRDPITIMSGCFLNYKCSKDYREFIENPKEVKKYNRDHHKYNNLINKESLLRFRKLKENPFLPHYDYIEKNTKRITIDAVAAIEHIDWLLDGKRKIRPQRIALIDKKTGNNYPFWSKDRRMTKGIARNWKKVVEKIASGLIWLSCPESTNRIYSTITSLPSELRQFLRLNGEPLSYGDVSNSQPLFFVKFLNDEYGYNPPDDVKHYIKLVKDGHFYEYLMDKMGKPELKKRDISTMTEKELSEYEINRAIFKIDFFGKVFFDNEKKMWKERQVFIQCFPSVHSVVKKMKAEDYRNLSLSLQKFEASVIINEVFRRLANEYPDSCCVPIHDAVICEQQMVKRVQTIMEEEIYRAIGYVPTIKFREL
jgi:hypothetical protein